MRQARASVRRGLHSHPSIDRLTGGGIQSCTNDRDRAINGFAWTILETNGVSNRGFVEVIAPGAEPSSILQPAGWSHFVRADGDRWRITWVYDGLVPADPNEAVTVGASPLNFSFFSAMDQAFQDAPSPLVLEGTLFGRRPTGLPLPFPSAQFGTVAFTSTGTLASGGNTPPPPPGSILSPSTSQRVHK